MDDIGIGLCRYENTFPTSVHMIELFKTVHELYENYPGLNSHISGPGNGNHTYCSISWRFDCQLYFGIYFMEHHTLHRLGELKVFIFKTLFQLTKQNRVVQA